MITLMNTPQIFYCIGGRTGIAISPVGNSLKTGSANDVRAFITCGVPSISQTPG
jgi:hypothetical protein